MRLHDQWIARGGAERYYDWLRNRRFRSVGIPGAQANPDKIGTFSI
jgi:methyltransferase-like protein